MALERSSLRKKLKKQEGCIPHMYLDTKGLVTVGVGQLLKNSDAAMDLPFVNGNSEEPAAKEIIEQEYQTIADQDEGRVASHYRQFTNLILQDSFIDELLDSRIDEFMQGLNKKLTNFDEFPEPAQEALLDMAFNLGLTGMVTKFPSMIKHVKEQDWRGCAKECRRKGIGETRNDETKALFEHAAEP